MKGTRVKRKFVLMLILSCLLSSGCNSNDFLRNSLNKMAPDDDEAFAKECLTALRNGDFQTVIKHSDPQIVKPGIEYDLTRISNLLAHGDPLALELVGCNVFSTSEKRRTNLTYQYQFADAWVLAAVTIDSIGDSKKVIGVNVNPIPRSLGDLNAFTLSGKSIKHYMLMTIAVIVPIFIIFTIVVCVRTKMRKKWLWVLFILIGVAGLKLNWTTGQIGLQPISFHLLGSGISKMGLYAPWILTISFPLGAVMFLIKRNKLQAAQYGKEDLSEPEAGRVLPEAAFDKDPDEPST